MNTGESRSALFSAIAVQVDEDRCRLRSNGQSLAARYAPQFPRPRTERLSPGHLVAVVIDPRGQGVVLWRWYDAVVLEQLDEDSVRLWEPAHGEVVAKTRQTYRPVPVGSRAWASAGLPGAEWWVAGPVTSEFEPAGVELDAVVALYIDNGLWETALAD